MTRDPLHRHHEYEPRASQEALKNIKNRGPNCIYFLKLPLTPQTTPFEAYKPQSDVQTVSKVTEYVQKGFPFDVIFDTFSDFFGHCGIVASNTCTDSSKVTLKSRKSIQMRRHLAAILLSIPVMLQRPCPKGQANNNDLQQSGSTDLR